MRCAHCGSESFSPPRDVTLTDHSGSIALKTRNDRGKQTVAYIRATVCRSCGVVVLGVALDGLDWSSS